MSFSVFFQNYNIYLLLAAAEGEWSSFVHISKQEISQIFASELVPKHINIDSVTVSLFVHLTSDLTNRETVAATLCERLQNL